jgi:hypothetical protein
MNSYMEQTTLGVMYKQINLGNIHMHVDVYNAE